MIGLGILINIVGVIGVIAAIIMFMAYSGPDHEADFKVGMTATIVLVICLLTAAVAQPFYSQAKIDALSCASVDEI